MLRSLCLSVALATVGCQGALLHTAVAAADLPTAPAPDGTASRGASACTALPPLPARPARVRNVTEFGVTPSDSADNTEALQKALNALSPGEWLVFPPGRYLHSKSLHVKVPNIVMWGEGATLQATNPGDQAVMIEADGASIYKFTLIAVSDKRRTAPWESRIAIFGGAKAARLLTGNVIRGNRIIEGGDPGSPLANSTSTAGILIYHASNFLVAENTVSRSLADGIHVTAGSSYGRVLNNNVKETGDDMIAVVSYIGDPTTNAATIAAEFDERKARSLNHHIMIANNTLSGQYWGRGISVVGGENIAIEHNSIDRTTHGAAIYLARETSYVTLGVRDVLVRDNTITDVQTTTPQYTGGTVSTMAPKTGHGAIEVYSWLFKDEAANDRLRDALSVQDIRIESNTITRVRGDAVRIAKGSGQTWSFTGRGVTRDVTGGKVGRIVLANNKITSIGGQAIAIPNEPAEPLSMACEANAQEGKTVVHRLCSAGAPPAVPDCPW